MFDLKLEVDTLFAVMEEGEITERLDKNSRGK